jgi:hypothetical protein
MAKKPDLALDIEVEGADGTTERLPCDSQKASKRPLLQPFSTQRGDGFTTGGVQLTREIFKDYPDISLMDTWRYVGRQGDVAYEGRHHSNPRTNDPQQQIGVQLVGWAASYLKAYKIDPLVVDRRFSSWQPPGLARRSYLLEQGATLAHYQQSSDFGGLRFDGESGQTIPQGADAEVIYDAGARNRIAKLMYRGKESNSANVEAPSVYTDVSEDLIGKAATALTLDGTLHTAAITTPQRFAMLRALATATHTPAAGSPLSRTFEQLAAYGDTGLTTRPLEGEPDGIWLSDLLSWILATFYPKMKLAGRQNTFPVTQADWRDNKSFGYDVIQQLNNLAMWETSVFEDRTLHFEPADLTTYDWVFRTDDPGVKVTFQGDSIEDFANGIEITFTGFDGVKQTLYPEDHPELRDDSENNPANRHKEKLYIEKEITWRCSLAEALQIGRAYLKEFNRPKRPGSYQIAGHIQDAARHWHQGWKARNSMTVGILDHPDDEPRLLTATTWDPQSEVLNLTVDAPPKTLEAQVARQELARQANNLA